MAQACGSQSCGQLIFATRQRFWMLLLATLLAIAGAGWLAQRKGAESESQSELWLPGLRGDLERITALHLIGAGDKRLVTIARDATGFVVVERDRYRADTVILRTMLSQIADARRVEAKTARPDRHATLGVESLASAKATGVGVEIEGLGKPLMLTVGRTADQLGGGTFVRTGDDKQAWLVSGNLVIEREPQGWLEKRIVDIPASRVERVEVRDSGGRFALVRETPMPGEGTDSVSGNDESVGIAPEAAVAPVDSGSDSFVVEGVAIADMSSPFAAAATTGALSELDLLDVRARKSAPTPARGVTELRFILRNGVTVTATAWIQSGKTQLQLRAAATPTVESVGIVETVPASSITPAPTVGSDGATARIASPNSSGAPSKAVNLAVAAFNAQWQNWTYVLPSHRSAGMTPTRLGLLKPTGVP